MSDDRGRKAGVRGEHFHGSGHVAGVSLRKPRRTKQDVDRSIRFFWTISQAQIYPSLERLERDGLITGRDEPIGRRRRRVFKITDAGRTALRGWLANAEPIPFELRDVGLLKLFFADACPPTKADELLEAVLRRSQERVATLTAIRPAADELRAQGNTSRGLRSRWALPSTRRWPTSAPASPLTLLLDLQ